MADSPAVTMLRKLRGFVAERLDDEERKLFAVLIGPAVAQAHGSAEVSGFGVTGWSLPDLPEALAEALDAEGIRITGFDI